MATKLLDGFRAEFQGERYIHRDQTIGNFISSHLYEDLLDLGLSRKFVAGVAAAQNVVNNRNNVTGREGRRGDGTFGELVPGESATTEPGFSVKRGLVATLQIGTECKILAKSMIKQIDRVKHDLRGQAEVFESQTSNVIRVGLVGVNFASEYTSYEGERLYPAKPPPAREAPEAIARIERDVRRYYDELIILGFRASNVDPYPFDWVNESELKRHYNAALLRISRQFDSRF